MALPVVLATILLLVVIAAGVTAQVRTDLKAAHAETDALQAQTLIWSGFQDALQQVKTDPGNVAASAPDPTAPPAPGWASCHLQQSPSGNGYLCIDFLRRAQGWVVIDNLDIEVVQIPVAVRWKIHASDATHTSYGWVVLPVDRDPATNAFLGYGPARVYYNHQWCMPNDSFDPANGNFNFCRYGG